jgi:hypothetical protein
MSKTPSSSLFMLVHALNRSECRYFKVYAQRHVIGGQNKYTRLFGNLKKQESFDDEALFETGLFGTRKHYTEQKRYLFSLLLEMLAAFHKDKTPYARLERRIREAQLLREKGLLAESASHLKKAGRLARHEPALIPALLKEQEETAIGRLHLNQLRELADPATKRSWLREYELCTRYRALYLQLHVVYYQSRAGLSKRIEAIGRQVKPRELEHTSWEETKLYGYSILEIFYQTGGDEERCLRVREKILAIEKKRLDYSTGETYLVALANLAYSCIRTKRYREAAKLVQEMLPLRDKGNKTFRCYAMLVRYSTQCNLLQPQEKHENVFGLLEKFRRERLPDPLPDSCQPPWLQLQFSFAYSAFRTRRFRDALKQVNLVRNLGPHPAVGHHIHEITDVLNLILHYELGNHDGLETLIEATKRALQKRRKLHAIERLLFNHLGALLVTARSDQRKLWKRFSSGIEPLLDDPDERKFHALINLQEWAKMH